jgi:hypothetical protein
VVALLDDGAHRRRRSNLLTRVLAGMAATVVATTGLTLVGTAPTQAAVVKVRLVGVIKQLPVAAENRAGYDRDKFRLWVDADGDCQDTRDEVLARESLVRARGCDVQVGKWRSYYDGVVSRRSSGFDIDHLVPLAEAWDSGASRWTAGTRRRYANDLGDGRSLVAVTASSNRSKSDQDPAQWQPRLGKCVYLRQWVAVKLRWRLTVNTAEKRALLSRASRCANVVVTVHRATVVRASATSPAGPAPSGNNDPRFAFCYQAVAAGYGPYYRGRDPEYAWYTDGDSDGVVCE